MCSGPNEPDLREADLAFSDVILNDEILFGLSGISEVDRENSEKAIPKRFSGDGSSLPRLMASDDDVLIWYRDVYVLEQEKMGNRPSREDDWQAAQREFGNRVRYYQICGKKGFRGARARFAPVEWSKDGPKRARMKPA